MQHAGKCEKLKLTCKDNSLDTKRSSAREKNFLTKTGGQHAAKCEKLKLTCRHNSLYTKRSSAREKTLLPLGATPNLRSENLKMLPRDEENLWWETISICDQHIGRGDERWLYYHTTFKMRIHP